MTTSDLARRMPVGAPDLVSQTTAVEQSRAVAQVLAAYQRADARPRDIRSAVAEMREVCGMLALAERAFYSYRRSGSDVTGPTIHLARELARIWGNLDYGLVELRRDDVAGYSEMLAFATDLQTNVRVSSGFNVPHGRDTKQGRTVLTELRDIYENNTNMGSRRVRTQLYAVLPKWLTDDAEQICRATLKSGGNTSKPLRQRVDEAIATFRGIGVTLDRIESRFGKSSGWSADVVADLGIVFRTIQRREQTIDDAFPEQGVTAEEIRQQSAARRQPQDTPAPVIPADGDDPEPGRGQQ